MHPFPDWVSPFLSSTHPHNQPIVPCEIFWSADDTTDQLVKKAATSDSDDDEYADYEDAYYDAVILSYSTTTGLFHVRFEGEDLTHNIKLVQKNVRPSTEFWNRRAKMFLGDLRPSTKLLTDEEEDDEEELFSHALLTSTTTPVPASLIPQLQSLLAELPHLTDPADEATSSRLDLYLQKLIFCNFQSDSNKFDTVVTEEQFNDRLATTVNFPPPPPLPRSNSKSKIQLYPNTNIYNKVSERMKCAIWLQTAASTTKLTHPFRLNAPRFARRFARRR